MYAFAIILCSTECWYLNVFDQAFSGSINNRVYYYKGSIKYKLMLQHRKLKFF